MVVIHLKGLNSEYRADNIAYIYLSLVTIFKPKLATSLAINIMISKKQNNCRTLYASSADAQ